MSTVSRRLWACLEGSRQLTGKVGDAFDLDDDVCHRPNVLIMTS